MMFNILNSMHPEIEYELVVILNFWKNIDFLKRHVRFIAKLNRKYRDFLFASCSYKSNLLHVDIPTRNYVNYNKWTYIDNPEYSLEGLMLKLQ